MADRVWRIVRRVVGLFVGAFQLFVLVNACVRTVGGRWLFGSLAAGLRMLLLIAVTMASARIRVAGAEPSSGFFVALYAGPCLDVVLSVTARRRRGALPPGSEEEGAADRVWKSWLAVTAMDGLLVAVGLGARALGSHP
jgi:hypothetical protein